MHEELDVPLRNIVLRGLAFPLRDRSNVILVHWYYECFRLIICPLMTSQSRMIAANIQGDGTRPQGVMFDMTKEPTNKHEHRAIVR